MALKTISLSLLGVAILGGAVALVMASENAARTTTSEERLPPLVTAATVTQITRPPALVTTGFIRPSDPLTLTTEVAGRVTYIHPDFEIGGRIAADTPVIELDKTPYEAELMRSESAVLSAEAALMRADNALSRQQTLAVSDFASEARIEELEAARAAAKADLGAARASVTIAQDQVADATLTVPFSALVTADEVSLGMLVQPGQRIGDVVRAERAELRTALTETDYRRFTNADGMLGHRVIVHLRDGGEPVEAEVAAVSPQLDGMSRMVDIIAIIDSPFDGATSFLLNALVDVEIPLPDAQRPVLSVPLAALQARQRIWRLDEQNRLNAVSFDIERQTEDTVFLLSDDLVAGDRVLTTALQTQVEGREVRIGGGEGG